MGHKINFHKIAKEPGGGCKGLDLIYRQYLPEKVTDIVEIGTDYGFFSFTFAHDFPRAKVVTVDNYAGNGCRDCGGRNHVERWIKHYPNLRQIVSDGVAAAKLFADDSLDVVFIDALHDYASVSADYAAWEPKLRRGGVVMFHDTESCPDIGRFFNELPGKKAHVTGMCGLGFWYKE